MSADSIIFQTVDPRGISVILTGGALEHSREGHPEMQEVPVGVYRSTIEDPDVIYPAHFGAEMYLTLGAALTRPRLYVAVVVNNGMQPGDVLTAYLQKGIGGVEGLPRYIRPRKR